LLIQFAWLLERYGIFARAIFPQWFNLLKTNAATRGWLAVSAPDVRVQRNGRQTNYSSHFSLGNKMEQDTAGCDALSANIL
jgi:hypothetical protein